MADTTSDLERQVEDSVRLFMRAQVGEMTPLESRRPDRVLLVLDGSDQDSSGVAVARYMVDRLQATLLVLDAREDAQDDLAPLVARDLEAEALPRGRGTAFEQILEALETSGCDLVVVPSPFGRDLESVGADSTGTVVDVLLARSPVPVLVIRGPFPTEARMFRRARLAVEGEDAAARAAAAATLGLLAEGSDLLLVVVLDEEFYENLLEIMEILDPEADLRPDAVSDALAKAHMRLHRSLQKATEDLGLAYRLRIDRGEDKLAAELARLSPETLLVLPLDRNHPHAQARVADGIRRSSCLVLAVPIGARPESEVSSPEA